MRHIIPISGKDSLATAILQNELHPEHEYEYVFNFTGWELPEQLDWLDKVEAYFEKPIIKVGLNLSETEEYLSGFRPSITARYCTRKSKIEPTEQYFNGEGIIYYGLRADEPERIGYINKGKSELTPKYPLREHNVSLEGVLKICDYANLLPPSFHWQLLEDKFTAYLGYEFISQLTRYQRQMLFAWRKRLNCDRCFNMGRYEWLGLSVFHEDIFNNCMKDEETLLERGKPFYYIKDLPLRKLLDRFDDTIDRHIKRTGNLLLKYFESKGNSLTPEEIFTDALSFTSCGLLCGK